MRGQLISAVNKWQPFSTSALADQLQDRTPFGLWRFRIPRNFDCVPEDATNTKRVFSLLAQLIAITTAATDLSITPAVRVIQ
jgi:hypothetical protein